ncbi:endonuclease MutS2 [Halarsenatibacter silvermanii]|uniref:Endonuclease MutS2 n=1 Tax=Halarsenatibacter silvermanii TaxID=321763 RepID=A0A1G9K249_9FIRM|nr:endonuclease MutS2 [Halarsenatibacter silvermanii]SDL43752.1 DNA mismatch repair protein MutS2 [Halarsenatibacter silvermanii]
MALQKAHEQSLEMLEFSKIKDIVKDYAGTEPGQKRIDSLRPLKYRDEIERRLLEAEQASHILDEKGRPPLLAPENLEDLVMKANKELVLNPEEISSIDGVLRSSVNTADFFSDICTEQQESQSAESRLLEGPLQNYSEQLESLPGLRKEIDKVIDDKNEIKNTASSRLREIRKSMDRTEREIKNQLNRTIKKERDLLQDDVITRRENRYVVPVKQEHRNTFSGIIHGRSSSGMTVFMEPMAVVELNNKLRELRQQEEEEIHRILQELSFKIGQEAAVIRQNYRLLIKLDDCFARGGFMEDWDGTVPRINEKGIIDIKQGRHPLLGDEAVPIDIEVGDGFNTLVITGPNTGGKTVSLKTLGLFVVLTSAGVPLPAEDGSKISIFNNVFADIGDEQSIEQNLSTFSSHMNNIRTFLKQAGSESLVLLDEIGVGTDPREGAALAISILEEFKSRAAVSVATTHYSQLKSYAFTTENVENASVEFDVETLSPTYRLIMGIPGGSNAFEIALRLGLPERLIKEARSLLEKDELAVEEIIRELNEERQRFEELNSELEKKQARLDRREEELAAREKELEEKKQEIIEETRGKAKRDLKRLRTRSKEIISELKNSDFTDKRQVDKFETQLNLELKELKNYFSQDEKSTEKEPEADFSSGDKVKIKSVGKEGEIISIDEDDQKAEVQAGVMQITADLADLTPVREKSTAESNVKKYQVKKSDSISPSLDLRGDRYQEAQRKLRKYLDDAFLAGLNEVEVIHGKGSGALREAVREAADSHKHVKKYRGGKEGEGGMGVTIIKLQ